MEGITRGTYARATKSGSGFCAPYISTRYPRGLNSFDYIVITGEDVEVKAEPYETAPVISQLSYDIVRANNFFRLQDRIDGERHDWLEVTIPDGRLGYVWGKYTRGELDYRGCFNHVEGKWVLTYFLAGD